jgi:hypothetical protein
MSYTGSSVAISHCALFPGGTSEPGTAPESQHQKGAQPKIYGTVLAGSRHTGGYRRGCLRQR